MKLSKGELSFTMDGSDSLVCNELSGLSETFAAMFSEEEILAAIGEHVGIVRDNMRVRSGEYPDGEYKDVPQADRLVRGQEIFDEILSTFTVPGSTLLEELLFWLGDWWLYDLAIMRRLRRVSFEPIYESSSQFAEKYLRPILPEQVQKVVSDMELRAVSVNFGHFALMFIDEHHRVRRIVTDTQLLEVHDVHGYVYLDIMPDGKPVIRAGTSQGGGRAFFDGVRLMTHKSFMTCAPKTVVINGGYKVNSTNVTIINGSLFPLVDVDDTVAHTTGVFRGVYDFYQEDVIHSRELGEASKDIVSARDGVITLDGKILEPLGVFAPSAVTLLDSGFALFEPSAFDASAIHV